MTITLASVNPAASRPVSTNLAHDLRNTLSTIALHLETLERLSGPPGATAALAAQALVSQAAGICSSVLHEARDPDAPVLRTGFDIVTVIRQVANLLAPIAPKGFAIEVRADAPVIVLGNSQEVFRILFNLAHNAVAVARRTQPMSRLEIEVERIDETVAIRMTDDGPGLPKAVRLHLFSRPTGRFSTRSNGFGLAIARELAERNGGTLEVVAVRTGTAFNLVLAALGMVSVRSGPATRGPAVYGRTAHRRPQTVPQASV